MNAFLTTGTLPEDDAGKSVLFLDLFQCYVAENSTVDAIAFPAEHRIAPLEYIIKGVDNLDFSKAIQAGRRFKTVKVSECPSFGNQLGKFLQRHYRGSQITLGDAAVGDKKSRMSLNDLIENSPDLKVITLFMLGIQNLAIDEQLELGRISQLTIQGCSFDREKWCWILDAVGRSYLRVFELVDNKRYDLGYDNLKVTWPPIATAVKANKWLISFNGFDEIPEGIKQHLSNNIQQAREAHKKIQLLKNYETVKLPNEIVQLIARLGFESFYKKPEQ